jgi:hypothetical protein
MSRPGSKSKVGWLILSLITSYLTVEYFIVWLPQYAVAGVLYSHAHDNTVHWTAVGLLMATPGVAKPVGRRGGG